MYGYLACHLREDRVVIGNFPYCKETSADVMAAVHMEVLIKIFLDGKQKFEKHHVIDATKIPTPFFLYSP
jgi:hypothetical protein